MKRKIILIIILAIVIFAIYQGFLKEEKPKYALVEVKRGNVVQEVSETGQVQSGEEIKLGFKSAGIIEKIFVKTGDEVWFGSNLVKLDATQPSIELRQAQAALEVAKSKLNQLLAGSSQEEIQVAETTFKNAGRNLGDIEAKAQEDLNQTYEDALNTLDGAYETASTALTKVTLIQRTYFWGSDQESIVVREKKEGIEKTLAEARTDIDATKADPSNKNIDAALAQLKNTLGNIYNDLGIIRDMTETLNYKNTVSSTDKNTLDTQKVNINTALTDLIDAQQEITSTKITNQTNINDAQGKVEKAQNELDFKKAGPRQVDIDLYQAQVKEAQAKVDLLENQIREATLKSPVKGKVTRVNKRVGETVQPALSESVITILPTIPYEIKVDIYEEDIVKIEIGNPVDIELIALPERIFEGRVVFIDPAEKLIEGVVYYTITINFDRELPSGVKPGMTADVVIKTAVRENVLVIPEDAIGEKEEKKFVRVFKDGEIEEREVEVGLIGSNDLVEILVGLSEGEKVILE